MISIDLNVNNGTSGSFRRGMTNNEAGMTDRLCVHYGTCGGCSHQDVVYEEQLRRKSCILSDLLKGAWEAPIPVEPSPEQYHYRNKVDFTFGPKFYPEAPPKDFVRESVLGFKTKGRWFKPLDIHECLIAPEGVGSLVNAVREWMQSQQLQAFDTHKHTGFLKALLVRRGVRTGDRMVVLITADGSMDNASFVQTVNTVWPATTIQHGIYRGVADGAFAEECRVLQGPDTIDEALRLPGREGPRELLFRLSPFSFFQTNTLATEHLYQGIREWFSASPTGTLYDLYGGAGGIAFSCADLADQVYSVENVISATEDGRYNAWINNIDNVRFYTAKVEDYLQTAYDHRSFDACASVVLDPPRAGIHPKALRRLLQLLPYRILYVSCKPSALAGDLPALLEHYRITQVRGFDLFPHTDHVELLVGFERKSVHPHGY